MSINDLALCLKFITWKTCQRMAGGGGTEPDVREIKASSPGGTQEKLFLLAREISNILFILYRLKKSSENKEN